MSLSLSNVCPFINNLSTLPKIKYIALIVFLLACQCISILYIFVLIPQGEVTSVLDWLIWFCKTADTQFDSTLLRILVLFLFGIPALLSPLFLPVSLCSVPVALYFDRTHESKKVLTGITVYILLIAFLMLVFAAPGSTIFERVIAPSSILLTRMTVIFFAYLVCHRIASLKE